MLPAELGGNVHPLSGIRVVDLSTTFMGPYCTLLMAQMGADVLKVEAPGGDITRWIGDTTGAGLGSVFLNANQGKRSIAVDLRHPDGVTILRRLVSTADVFVHNMRPDAVARLGIGAEIIHNENPRCVYAALVGFGSEGPYRNRAAYDDVIQAISGVAAVQGVTGTPEYVRTPIADKAVGLLGLAAILAALVQRSVTGEGQSIEVPMFESMAAFILFEQQGGLIFDPPRGAAGYARTASPYRRPYATLDGHLAVVVYTDRQWASFFALIHRPELISHPAYKGIGERTMNIDELYQLVEEHLAMETSQYWQEHFDRAGIPAVPVSNIEDLFGDPHLEAVNFFVDMAHPVAGPTRMARFPGRFSHAESPMLGPAPSLGQHSSEVLRAVGYSDEEVAGLRGRKIVIGPPDTGDI